MKSKISFFNMGIYKSMLRRFWPLWLVHFGGLLLILPILTFVNSFGTYVDKDYVYYIVGGLTEASPAIAFAMALLSAMAVYSFMYNSRSTGLIASLPVRREAVFGSAWASAVSVVIATNIVIALLTFLCALPSVADSVNAFKVVFQWAAIYSLHFVLFFGIATITAVMTGNSIALPVLYIIFNFLAVGLELIGRAYCSLLVWGMESLSFSPVTDFLSPLVYIFSHNAVETTYQTVAQSASFGIYNEITGFAYMQWAPAIIYCIVGLILSAIALMMFKARRMETSGDFVSVSPLKPIFKYGIGVCVGLSGGLLLYVLFYSLFDQSSVAGLISMCIGIFVFGFIGYYGAKMLLSKSFHVFRGSWVGYIIMSLVCIVFLFCCDLDVMNLGGYTPDADDVEFISVYDAGKIEDRETIEKYVELQKKLVAKSDYYENYRDPTGDSFTASISFRYTLKNGHLVTRVYDVVWQDEYYNEYYALMNSPNVLKERFSTEVPVDSDHVLGAYLYYEGIDQEIELTARQAIDFYNNALMADIEAGNKMLYNYDSIVYGSLNISLADTADEENATCYYDIYVEINGHCINCINWIKDNLHIDIVKSYNDALGDSEYDYGYSEYGGAEDPTIAYANTHEG